MSRQYKHIKKAERKKRSGWLIAFFILLGVTALLCLAAFSIWFRGRNALLSQAAAPVLPTAAAEEEETEETPEKAPANGSVDENIVFYNGRRYRYKDSMCNLLFIGVDEDEKPAENDRAICDFQSDVLLLAAIDLESGQVTLLSIPRDTMCDMIVLDEEGNEQGVGRAQLALSYHFGNGLETSCERTCEAVSNLFYGLQIHGYGAFYLGGVSELNDAVGGVTVTVADDYDFTEIPGCSDMTAGAEVTLTGFQAQKYIRCRLSTEEGNFLRMQRQKQFLLSLIDRTRERTAEDPSYALSIYRALHSYIVTDMSLDRISYLASCASRMQLSDSFITLTGQSVVNERSELELTLDEQALIETMLNVFYTDVTEE